MSCPPSSLFLRRFRSNFTVINDFVGYNEGVNRVKFAYLEVALGNRAEAMRELQVADQLFYGRFDQIIHISQMAIAISPVGFCRVRECEFLYTTLLGRSR